MRRGRTDPANSFGRGLQERNPLLEEGIVEDEENKRLYVDYCN